MACFCYAEVIDPSLKLTALVPSYTAPLAEVCPFIDHVIIDSKKNDQTDFKTSCAGNQNRSSLME